MSSPLAVDGSMQNATTPQAPKVKGRGKGRRSSPNVTTAGGAQGVKSNAAPSSSPVPPDEDGRARMGSPSWSTSLMKHVGGLMPVVSSDRTYYLVNVERLVALFFDIAVFVTNQPSNQRAWVPTVHDLVAIFLRAFYVKCQAVAQHTNQAQWNTADLMSASFRVPAPVAMLVAQFGEFVDAHGVTIAPLLPPTFFAYVASVISHLEDRNVANNARTALINPGVARNFSNYVYFVYGRVQHIALCLLETAAVLGCPVPTPENEFTIGEAACYMVSVHRQNAAAAQLTGNQRAAYAQVLGAQAAPSPVSDWFDHLTHPNAFPAALAAPAATVAAFTAVYNRRCAVPTLPNVGQVQLSAVALARDQMQQEIHVGEMSRVFVCEQPPTSPFGTAAPLVRAQVLGYNTVCDSSVSGLSANEWVVGAMLNTDCVLVNRDGFAFNGATAQSRVRKYSATNITNTPMELLTATLRDAFAKRH